MKLSRTDSPASSSLFLVEGDTIVLKGWDERQSSGSLLSIAPDQFEEPKVVREKRLILVGGTVSAEPFFVPDLATTMTIVYRSRDFAQNWPRLRVLLSPADQGSASPHTWDHWMISRVIERKSFRIPNQLRGQPCQLKLELLNPDEPGNRSGKACFIARIEFE